MKPEFKNYTIEPGDDGADLHRAEAWCGVAYLGIVSMQNGIVFLPQTIHKPSEQQVVVDTFRAFVTVEGLELAPVTWRTVLRDNWWDVVIGAFTVVMLISFFAKCAGG